MKSRWNKTYKSSFDFSLPVPGIYKATTNTGRNVYTYAESSEVANLNFLKCMKWEETIKVMSRDNYKEEM